MSSVPTPAHGLSESKAKDKNEMSSSDQTGAPQESTTSKPSPKAIDQHSKPTTSTTSEEDASGQIPTKQAAANPTCKGIDNTVQTQKDGPDSETVGGSGDAEDSAAAVTDPRTDPESKKKTGRQKADNTSTTGELSDNDSQDESKMVDQFKEEEYLVYTAEGQKLFQERAGRRIGHFGQYFRSVEHRMRFIEWELQKLRGDDSNSKPKNNTEQAEHVSAIPSRVIPSIRRLTWAEFKPSLKPQEVPDIGTSEASRFTWEGLKVRPNLPKKGEAIFAKASSEQHHGTLGAASRHQHHVLEVS